MSEPDRVKVVKLRLGDGGPFCIVDRALFIEECITEWEQLQGSGPGETRQLYITLAEMSQEELDALPEFEGW